MVVLLFEKRFWEPLQSGLKVHSIRPTRKRPIKAGDELSLRGWSGAAYRSPQTVLRTETCIAVRRILIGQTGVLIDGYELLRGAYELKAFAKLDGFEDWPAMKAYRSLFGSFPFFEGDFIQWGVNDFLESRKLNVVN